MSQEFDSSLHIEKVSPYKNSNYLCIIEGFFGDSVGGYVVFDSSFSVQKEKLFRGLDFTHHDWNGNLIYDDAIVFYGGFSPALNKYDLDTGLAWSLDLEDVNNFPSEPSRTKIYKMPDDNILVKSRHQSLLKVDRNTGEILASLKVPDYLIHFCKIEGSKIYVFFHKGVRPATLNIGVLDLQFNPINQIELTVENRDLEYWHNPVENRTEIIGDSLISFKFGALDTSHIHYIAELNLKNDSITDVYGLPLPLYHFKHVNDDYIFSDSSGFGRLSKENIYECIPEDVPWSQQYINDFDIVDASLDYDLTSGGGDSVESNLYFEDVDYEQKNLCDPEILEADFQLVDDTICKGDDIEIVDGSVFNEGTSKWQLIHGNDVILKMEVGKSGITFDSKGLINGRYSVVHTTELFNHYDTSSKSVLIFNAPDVSINRPEKICPGEEAELKIEFEDQVLFDSLQWFREQTLLDKQVNSITVEDPGMYSVSYHRYGCSNSKTVTIEDCSRDLYFPNVFTPNGDGVNDTWHPLPTEDWTFDIQIFNVSGNRVYECRGLDCAWDGIFEGDSLNPGVFLYHVIATHEDGTEREYRGDVTLVR